MYATASISLALVTAINAQINQTPYRSDWASWQARDYWATPEEFARRGGDCEDYAIAKYFALREAGAPADALRLVYLYESKKPHMALFVRVGHGWRQLDNRDNRLLKPGKAPAVYAFNEERLWLATTASPAQWRAVGTADRIGQWRRLLKRRARAQESDLPWTGSGSESLAP